MSVNRLAEASGKRLAHAERAETLLAQGTEAVTRGKGARAALLFAEAQVHATLAVFYQGEARDLAGSA